MHKLEHKKNAMVCVHTKYFPAWSKDTKLIIKKVVLKNILYLDYYFYYYYF